MQQMMLEDFDPPLPTSFVEGNRGRLIVKAKDLVDWLEVQVRMVCRIIPLAERHMIYASQNAYLCHTLIRRQIVQQYRRSCMEEF